MPRSQLKLTASLAALVVLVVAVSGLLAEQRLRSGELARIEESLLRRAELARELFGNVPFVPGESARLDPLADRAGEAGGVRVTLIAPDGAIVADSEVAAPQLPVIESHSARPEVATALAGRVGRATRRSDTVGRDLLYVAVPAGAGGGVVRVAQDLSTLEAAVDALHRDLFIAGSVGILAALALSFALSWYTLRPIAELRTLAASIAGGELDAPVRLRPRDEIGDISQALQRVAGQLRERLEDATHEQERLHAVLDGMVEGVLVTDASGRILLANQRLREILDTWGDLVGRQVLEAVRDAELDALLTEAAGADEPLSRVMTRGHPSPRTLNVHAVRFPARGGPRMGTVAVFHDITELSRLEKVRRDFVANASHELRTPLAAIRGFAETLLSDEPLPENERRSYLEIIERHAIRLGHIVGDLLEISELESGGTDFELVPVELTSLIEALIGDSRPRFEEKDLSVSHRAQGTTVAWADSRAVEQIVRNLLDNAIQYTDPGGRIDVSLEGDERRVAIQVSDTGIGISEEDRDRIFERFYRVDKARSRALGGTGLGLSIVKHLIQGLGGEVTVESKPGQGATFRFTLATARPEARP